MANKINIRSPYYVKVSNGSLASATMELFIYTGIFTTDKGTAKYTITKNEIGTNNYVVFEIAELVRDYLDIEFNGEYDSQTVWVEADIELFSGINGGGSSLGTTSTDYIAFDGFGYFEEGINAELSRTYLQSNKEIFRPNDFNTRVPVFTEDTDSVSFLYQGEVKRVQAVTSSTNTNAQIDYITVSGSDNTDAYKERVLADGGVFEDNSLLQAFLNAVDIGLVDELYINSDSGTEVIKIRTEPCSKYEPYKVTFVNKYGALQDLWFFKKSVESTNVTSEQFKASIFDQSTLSYKTYKHQQQSFLAQGKDRITMNTGYVNDDHNAVLEELLLSEQVWYTKITDTEERVIPVIPQTKSITYKTSVNDKLANYTVDFEHAFDKINNIR